MAGCPCSGFDCIAPTSIPEVTTATVPATTTPQNGNAVLLLSTYNLNNKPAIVDFSGKYHKFSEKLNPIGFQEILTRTCHLNMASTHKLLMDARRQSKMNFGTLVDLPRTNVRYNSENIYKIYLFVLYQASKIVGCRLERQTDLNFDFYVGACNTFNQSEPKILLCFDWSNTRECHT